MKSSAALFVLVLFLSFTGTAHADFELLRKIPAPSMACDNGSPVIKAMGSDGLYLCLTRGCYLDNQAEFLRIEPGDGAVVGTDEWDYDLPGCPAGTMPLSMAFCVYDGAYYVGTDCGAVVGLVWESADSAWMYNMFSFGDTLQVPTGMASGQYSDLFASDRADTDLVRFDCTGYFQSDTPMAGVGRPVGMAEYDERLFVLDGDNEFIVEITYGASVVDTHYVEDWGGETDTFHPSAATFVGEELFLAGNEDSIHVYREIQEENYSAPAPEGDSVEVVVIPEELVLTFDTVTDSGDVDVDVRNTDDCDPPAGVTLFAEYYDIGTDATFEYVTEVAIMDSVYPEGVDLDIVRVFSRPSDTCGVWRDVTVAPVEEIPVLKVFMRSKSEDDEFSIFAIGEDERTPQEVVEYKMADLRGHVESAEDSIPAETYADIVAILDAAEADYYMGMTEGAVTEIDSLDDEVRSDPSIPRTFDPADPGRNVAGRMLSRAHTLRFSLEYSAENRYYSAATVMPANIHVGLRFDWLRVFMEVPADLEAAEVDIDHIYLENEVRAVPESTAVFDFDSDGDPEIRAMFPGAAAQSALAGSGCSSVANVSCFVGGFELHSAGDIDLSEPVVAVAADGVLLSGETARVSWERFACSGSPAYRLAFSADGGETWDLVAEEIPVEYFDWLVPDSPTDVGLLRVACGAPGDEAIAVYSDLFALRSGAGVDDEPAAGFMLVLGPNPAGGAVEIEFRAVEGERADVTVYSVTGEVVRHLFDGRVAAGANRIAWNGDNDQGRPVSAGTYFVVLRSGTRTLAEKVVVRR